MARLCLRLVKAELTVDYTSETKPIFSRLQQTQPGFRAALVTGVPSGMKREVGSKPKLPPQL
jgi:hypothetical protein